ncbi:MAG: hypothetical protein IKE81_02155, partial [Clostridia bacterium]|nr:hypothetical protein [Clostridia bacterium]
WMKQGWEPIILNLFMTGSLYSIRNQNDTEKNVYPSITAMRSAGEETAQALDRAPEERMEQNGRTER